VIAPTLIEPTLGRKPAFIQAKGKWWFRRTSADTDRTLQTEQSSARSGGKRNDGGLPPLIQNLFYVAASGSLIPLAVIQKIGGMNEDLGIYFVDTEFCLRARKAGLDIVAIPTATMEHSFGNVSRHLGGVTTTNHSAEARFRMFRNRKKLWRNYWQSDAGYVIFDILRSLSEIIRVMLFEAQKCQKLTAIMRGLFSG
jgi:rhamnosyltransferase